MAGNRRVDKLAQPGSILDKLKKNRQAVESGNPAGTAPVVGGTSSSSSSSKRAPTPVESAQQRASDRLEEMRKRFQGKKPWNQ